MMHAQFSHVLYSIQLYKYNSLSALNTSWRWSVTLLEAVMQRAGSTGVMDPPML